MSGKKIAGPLQVSRESCRDELKYLKVLFRSEKQMEREIDRGLVQHLQRCSHCIEQL